jgi:DNA recombination protein RmuC
VNTTVFAVIGLVLATAILAALGLVLMRMRSAQEPSSQVTAMLHGISQTMSQGAIQTATMAERLAQLEPVQKGVAAAQLELRSLAERLASVEKIQTGAARGIGDLNNLSGSSFAEIRTLAKNLGDATSAMREELGRAKTDLTEIKAHEKVDTEMSTQVAESVRRLEEIIAGSQSKGAAGENILEPVFAKLPQEWQVRDFKVGGKAVEFGLRLPNNLILPIDSKWPATDMLERLAVAQSTEEQLRIKKQIEDCVYAKAREVEKYIDPSITVSIGVAVVPDAVYHLCPGARVEAFGRNVAIISYSMFIPYLLLVYQTALANAHSIDAQKLSSFLVTIEKVSQELLEEVEGRLSRGLTMITNARDDLRVHAGRLSTSAMALQVDAVPALPPVTTPTQLVAN